MKNKWKEFKLKMFGFTLIELLAVIIILAIVALIATPIILNVIKDARDSADMSSAQLIANEGHNYYAGAMLDKIKKEDIELEKDIYSKLNITNKPEIGQLYVNKKNEVAMAIVINNKCYKKTYESEIEVVDVAECELGYMGPDSVNPEVSQKVINTSINENGWYKEDIYVEIEVKDNESGAKGYKRCMGQSECEPSEDIYEVDNKIYINIESATNYVCVIGVDRKGNESEKKCEVYKLDKTQPNVEGIEDKVVQKDEKVDLSDGVRYDDTLSGIEGEIIIEPSSIDTSETGTKQVKYKVIDKAGNIREVIRNIIVDAEAPTIEYNLVNESSINSNGWAKENFYVRATITDNSGSGIRSAKSCVSNSSSECSPIAEISGNTKEFYIEVEGSNRLCIEVTDNNNKTNKICSDTYKLDKTAPIAGTANIIGTLGSNGWYTSDVTINVVNGNDNLSGHLSTTSNITSITSNTIGQTVIITTTDLAGNTSNKEYIVKVDKNSPTLTAKSGNVEITEKDSNLVSNYFNVSYSISGGNISCSPTNTNSLSVGTHTLSCTATGGNGKTSNASINVKVKSIGYMYYTSAQKADSNKWDLYRCNIDGSNCINKALIYGNIVIQENRTLSSAPTVSVGEQYMYYTSAEKADAEDWDLYRCNIDGSGCTNIKKIYGNINWQNNQAFSAAPTVSVGEQYMYYTSAEKADSNKWGLYRCNIDGSNCTKLTSIYGNIVIQINKTLASAPTVSVGKQYIYYTSAQRADAEDWDLYRCNIDGSGCTNIKKIYGNINWQENKSFSAAPTVSVGEQYMYYTSAEKADSNKWDLYRCNIDGSNCTELTSIYGNIVIQENRTLASAPTVSVGERYIYYTSAEKADSNKWDLYRCNIDGSNCTKLASIYGNINWSNYSAFASSPDVSIK